MPSIQESVQKHQELLSEGKGTPVQSVPENSPILPEPASIGQLGPSRGSFVPGQVLDTDIAKQNIIGTPERSRMFPIPSNNGNNNAGIQQALKSIVKASEASVAQTVASFKNTPVATTDPSTGLLTQTTIGQSTPLPSAPPERRIPLDNVGDGFVFGRTLQTALTVNQIDLSKTGVLSKGARAFSVSPSLAFVPAATSIGFHYDGTNNSLPLHLFRDDGSVLNLSGSQNITGLNSAQTYHFYPAYDESSGTIVWGTDFTPNAFIGANLSVTNNAGVDTFQNVQTANSLSSSALAFSIEFWFQATAAQNLYSWQLSTTQSGNGGGTTSLIAGVLLSSSTQIELQTFTGSVLDIFTGTASASFFDGQPHHCVVTLTAAGAAKIYLDGVALTTGGTSSALPARTVFNLIYGPFNNTSAPTNSCWMSRVAFYSGVVLTASQVANHFNCAVNLTIAAYDTLVATDGATNYWKLDETSGTTAADSIGTNTGTYENSPTLNVSESTVVFAGTPMIAQTRPSYLALQRQNLSFRVPLSNGNIAATTGGSSGGGGIQPGGGGGSGKFTQFF